MKIQRDISQVFGFLSRRIIEFEMITDPPTKAYRCEDIIYDIFLSIDKFKAEDVLYHATLIYERIQPLLKFDFNEEVRNELEYYSESLDTIIQPRKTLLSQFKLNSQPSSESVSQPNIVNEIHLPTDFKVGDFIGHFKGWITIPQVSMFFYYLNKAKLMPNYSASSLGQLAIPLFNRNEKGVRDDYPNTSSYIEDKEKLEEFKQVLEAIQKEFEEDYKKAR